LVVAGLDNPNRPHVNHNTFWIFQRAVNDIFCAVRRFGYFFYFVCLGDFQKRLLKFVNILLIKPSDLKNLAFDFPTAWVAESR